VRVVSLRSLLREPLVHFLSIGVALFLVFGLAGDPKTSRKPRIVVTSADIDRLVATWSQTWQRPPTDEELVGLVDDFVRDEVYYRQALEMGLDRDDEIVHRRLRQKLESLTQNLLAGMEPSEADLRELLDREPERFRVEASISLSQVFFNPDLHGSSTEADLRSALARLQGAGPEAGADLGDPLAVASRLDSLSMSDLRGLFGSEFSTTVMSLPTGSWQGPVASEYGLHLVYVRERTDGRVPELDEVREEVRQEWIAERRAETSREFYDDMRARYDITVEWPDTGDGADASGTD